MNQIIQRTKMELSKNQWEYIGKQAGWIKEAQSSENKIYWKDIPPNAVIKIDGNHYDYNGKVVYWDGATAIEAQLFLKSLLQSP